MTVARSVRTVVIVALTIVGLILEGSDLMLPWHPYATFGFRMDARCEVVSVYLDSARSLHVGDAVDVARLSPEDRLALGDNGMHVVQPGRVIHLTLRSGRDVTVTAQTTRRRGVDNISDIIEVLAMLAYLLLAAALALLRPTPATWAFYVFSYTFCTFSATPNTWPFAVGMPAFALFSLARAVSPGAFVAFALRFPAASPRGGWKIVERAALFVVTPCLVASSVRAFAYIFTGSPASAWVQATAQFLSIGAYAAGVLALIARYGSATAEERNRLRWVVSGFAVAFLPFLALTFAWNQGLLFPDAVTINLCQACAIFAPAALAYTVLKHRLFDIRLVVSRALMYTAMTSLVIGSLALVDWAFGKWLEQSRLATIAELALTLFLGAAMAVLHRHIERILNHVIFRAQTLALAGLRRFAQETDLIADPQRLICQTYDALHSRLEAEYVAIYTAEGSCYALTTPRQPELPQMLPADDFAVLRVRRWGEAFTCDEPSHPLRNALFVPMTARTRVVGFVVCGPKSDRTHYLPEEVETLSTLSHHVASSYLWLTQIPAAALLSTPSYESS